MLTFESVKKIFEEENSNKGKLSKIDERFYEEVFDYLKKKENASMSKEERWRFESIKKRVENIIEIREKKILAASVDNVKSGFVPDNMVKCEIDFFEDAVKLVKKFNERLKKVGVEQKNMMVEIKKEVDKFVDENMNVYGPFKPGDIANIPEEIAMLMVKKGYAKGIKS